MKNKRNVYTEVCRNDNTNIFAGDYMSLMGLPQYVTEKGKAYYISPYLSFGDYDNSCEIERANVKVFLEMFPNEEDVKHWKGHHYSECIMIDILCENEEIIKVLQSLFNYPAINDEAVSKVRFEMEEESFNHYIERDLKQEIINKYDLLDIDIDSDDFFSFYLDLCEQSNTDYIVESGGNGYIDIDRLIEVLPDECPAILKPIK